MSSYKDFSPEEQETFREWLKGLLRTSDVEVEFLKKDGTTRVMNCTLNSEKTLPYEKKTDRTKTVNEEVCPVFDLDKQEWRSFRFDAVVSIKGTL